MATLDDALEAFAGTTGETMQETKATPSFEITATPKPDPMADAISSWADADDSNQLKDAAALGLKKDPAKSTKILQLFGKTGLPRDFIERNQAFVEQESAKQGFDADRLMKESPAFASWLAEHPDHVAAAMPDLSKIGYLEKQWRYIGSSREAGTLMDELVDLGGKSFNETITPKERTRQAEIEKQLEAIGRSNEGLDLDVLSQVPGAMIEQFPNLMRGLKGKVEFGAKGLVTGTMAGAVVGSAAGPGGTAAGAIGGGTVGGLTGWRYGAAINAGEVERNAALLDYEKLKDDTGQPLDRSTIKGLALMAGAINGAVEGLTGLEAMIDKLPGVKQLTRKGMKDLLKTPTARAAILDLAKNVGGVAVTEGATEAFQMYVTKAGGELAKWAKDGGGPVDVLSRIFSSENFEQAKQEALRGAQAGGGTATVLSTPGLVQDFRQAKQAQQNKQAFEAMGKAAESAEFAKQLPDQLREIVERATKDGPVEQVYAPADAWNTYFQSQGVDPRAVYEEVTGNAEAYDQAVQTGQPLPIKTADYAAKLAGTEHNAFFAQELKTDLSQMNAREADEWMAMMDAQAQEGVQVAPITDPSAKIKQDIAGQLQAAGFDPTVADQYAALYEERYRARAERRGLGEDPAELFKQLNLQVSTQLPAILQTLGKQQTELDALLNRLRSGEVPKESEVFGQSLTEFLKEKGGLQDQGGELSNLGVDQEKKPFKKKLIQKGGKGLDDAATSAFEAGYITSPNIADLLEAISQETSSKPVYAIGKENTRLLDVQTNLESLKAFLDARGVDLASTPNEQIAAMMGESIQQTLPSEEGQTFAQGATEQAETFFSQAERVIEAKMPNKASAAQIKGILSPENGVKADELKWIGLDDFLKTKDTFTKDEVLAFVKANEVQVEEVEKGATSDSLAQLEQEMQSLTSKIDAARALAFGGSLGTVPPQVVSQVGQWAFDMALDNQQAGQSRNRLSALGLSDEHISAIKEYGELAAESKYLNEKILTARKGTETKFSSYQLPGGSNYRELLLTLPTKRLVYTAENVLPLAPGSDPAVSQPQVFWYFKTPDNVLQIPKSKYASEADALAYILDKKQPAPSVTENFTSSHFNEKNILAHVRFNDRTDANGNKVLFLEEVQSDWHQAGRKKGYQNSETTENAQRLAELKAQRDPLPEGDERMRLTREIMGLSPKSGGVPDAPFKKTWHELALKRMVRYAAEHGYDELAWTTGDQQAERYDLSKQVDHIDYRRQSPDRYELGVVDKNGNEVALPKSDFDAKELEDVVGKEIAQKIVNGEGKGGGGRMTLSGIDLKVGGEGMKGFYDSIIPAFLNKYGKKWGAKVGDVQIETGPQEVKVTDTYTDKSAPRETVHALPITDSMKESVLQGQALFQGDGSPKGSITFGEHSVSIKLLEKADLSTFVHESGHLYLNELIIDATTAGTNEQLRTDLDTILKWMGLDVTSASGAEAIKAAIQTKHHEQFARGFEAYAMEGKAPSQALREAFARFRQWFIQAYRSLTTGPLQVKLTKEVREVMDRMIATDEAIDAAAQEADVLPAFTDAESSGMTPTQWAAYEDLVRNASITSREKLQAKLMKQYQREQADWWKEKRAEMAATVTAEVNEEPEYIALAVLKTGKMPDGSDIPHGIAAMKLDKKGLVDVFGKDFVKRLPAKIMTTKDGMHHDAVAQLFGYSNGQDFVMALANARDKTQLIEAETDRRMQETYGDIRFDGTLAEEAEASVLNEQQEKVIEAELKAIQKKQREVEPFVKAAQTEAKAAQQTGRELLSTMIPTLKATRTLARNIISRMALKNIKANDYSVTARQASRKATQAIAKQDWVTAGHFKQQELLNLALYREAGIVKEQVEDARELAKGFFKADATLAKTRNVDLVNVGRAILAQYGFGTAQPKTAAEYLEPIQKYDQDLYNQWKPQVDALAPRPLDYRAMTVQEFTKLAEDLKALWLLSRRTQQAKIDGQLMDRADMIDLLTAELASKTTTEQSRILGEQSKWDDAKMGLLSWTSALRRVESWVDVMDGGNINGIFRRFIWNPIQDAAVSFRTAKADVLRQYLALIQPIEKTMTRDLIPAPELGQGYAFRGRSALLHAILHTGNDSNQAKLLGGYQWDASQWDAFIQRAQADGTLTKADYDYAQGVWDLLESIKPQAQQAHHEMYGYYFNEITARPIQTPWGEYRGGYVPAIADRVRSVDQAIREEKDLFDQAGNSFMFPTTGRGFTKSRVEAYTAPLALNLATIPVHLDKVMRFVHLEPRVKDAARLVTNKSLRTALDAMNPTVAKDMLVPWLQRAAQQTVSTPGKNRHADKLFRYLRGTVGAQMMVGNVVNTLQQLTGFSLSLTKVKGRYLRGALATYLKGPGTMAEAIHAKSPYMAQRTTTQVMDIQQSIDEIILNPTKYEVAKDFAKMHGYFMQQGTQNVVDLITWSGAYDQSVQDGAGEVEAVRSADAAVRQTQGSFDPESLSNFEAGTPFVRAFTMFYSYFNMQANLLGSEFQKVAESMGVKKGAGRAFYLYVIGFMIPAVLAELIVSGLGGFDPDDEDGYLNETISVLFGSQIRSALAFFPGVGPVAMAGINAFNKKWYDDRISTSPVISTLESAARAPHSLYQAMSEDGHSKRAVRDLLTLLGVVTGTPAGTLNKPLGYLADVYDGVATPENALDVGRGIVTGKDVNRKK